MILRELFERPIEMRRVKVGHNPWAVEFVVDGVEYVAYASPEIRRASSFGFMAKHGNGWIKSPGPKLGNSLRVYSAVAQALAKFLEERKPEFVEISGASPKQHRLYQKMVDHFGMPNNYIFIDGENGELILARKEWY